MRDYVKNLQYYLECFTSSPSQETAETLIAKIFYFGPYDALGGSSHSEPFTDANDKEAAEIVKSIIQLYPEINLNCRIRPSKEKLNNYGYEGWERIDHGAKIFPVYAMKVYQDVYGDYTDYDIYYTPCTPLMYAALFNMPAVMKVLLNHPAIDVTVLTGEPKGFDPGHSRLYQATAYSMLPMLAFTCRNMLWEAAVKQFYRDAFQAEVNQKDALVKKYQDYGIKPDHLCKYILNTIMERVNAHEDTEEKIQVLEGEKCGLPVNNALAAFLGDAKLAELEKMLNAEWIKQSQKLATKAPTISFTDRTDQGGGVNNDPPAQTRSALDYLQLVFPTKIAPSRK